MLEQQKNQPVVYDANGVPFTIYKTTKPTKSGPKDYWVLEERFTTGRRRLLNNKSLKAAKERADKIRAAHIKGQAAAGNAARPFAGNRFQPGRPPF